MDENPRCGLIQRRSSREACKVRRSTWAFFLAVFDDDHRGLQSWVTFLVELETAAYAIELNRLESITEFGLIDRSRLVECLQGSGHRVVALRMHEIGVFVVGGTNLSDEGFSGLIVSNGGDAEMRRIISPFRGAPCELSEFGMGLAVRSEIGQVNTHLPHLFDDQRALRVAGPVD